MRVSVYVCFFLLLLNRALQGYYDAGLFHPITDAFCENKPFRVKLWGDEIIRLLLKEAWLLNHSTKCNLRSFVTFPVFFFSRFLTVFFFDSEDRRCRWWQWLWTHWTHVLMRVKAAPSLFFYQLWTFYLSGLVQQKLIIPDNQRTGGDFGFVWMTNTFEQRNVSQQLPSQRINIC